MISNGINIIFAIFCCANLLSSCACHDPGIFKDGSDIDVVSNDADVGYCDHDFFVNSDSADVNI